MFGLFIDTCCLPGSSPNRHFERREDPGDEVDGFQLGYITPVQFSVDTWQFQTILPFCPKLPLVHVRRLRPGSLFISVEISAIRRRGYRAPFFERQLVCSLQSRRAGPFCSSPSSPFPGEGGHSTKFYTGRLRPEVQTLTL